MPRDHIFHRMCRLPFVLVIVLSVYLSLDHLVSAPPPGDLRRGKFDRDRNQSSFYS